MSKTHKSISPTNYLSHLLTNRQKNVKITRKANKANKANKAQNKNNMSEEQVLFIQNEFTPSNMTITLTDEKLYKK